MASLVTFFLFGERVREGKASTHIESRDTRTLESEGLEDGKGLEMKQVRGTD